MILYYAIRQVLPKILHGKDYKHTDAYKSWKMLRDFRKFGRAGGGKSLINIYLESDKLAKIYRCFPETYFRFGMFMKDFGDFERMKSFIPQKAYARYAKDKVSQYHILIDDKILFHNIMRMYELPVPERYFIYQDKTFRKDGQIISDQQVDDIIAKITDERVFIKRYRGGAASGITIAIRKEDGYYTEKGIRLSASSIREYYSDYNYIFEKQLVQEKILRQFNPDSVNTIRILTYKHKPISAAVRFGGKGDYYDNVSKGGVAVSIDLRTGSLEEYGMRMYDINKYYEHPDTHIKFKGVVVPDWEKIVRIVEEAESVLPYYNSVGYDIATTINGPVIIEINTGAGVNLSQTGKKKGIADKFKQ